MLWSVIGTLGKYMINSYNKRVDSDTQIQLELIKSHAAGSANNASVIKAAMAHKLFWVVWALFAVPLGGWWALVMLDTMTPAHILNLGIPALPATVKPYADQIFNNVFYSGAAVGGVQIASRGLFAWLSGRR